MRGREQNKKTEKKSRLRSERLRTEEGKLKYDAALSHKLRAAKCVNGDEVEAAWNEFKRDILEVVEVVCGRKSRGPHGRASRSNWQQKARRRHIRGG